MLKALLPSGKKPRRVVMGPARGAVLPLHLQYEMRLFLGVYERELWGAYRALLKPGMPAFDIGGRDGYSALLIHSVTKAPVISFEAEACAAAEMQRTFALNSQSLSAVHAFNGAGGMTLDDAARRFGNPRFLKMDIEGAEVDALESGRALLATKPNIILEVHGHAEERSCLKILAGHGYQVRIIDRATLFPERRPLPHNRWIAASAA